MTAFARAAAIVLTAAAVISAWPSAAAGGLFDQAAVDFARQVETAKLELLAVDCAGRTAILDTLARQELSQMYGRGGIDGTSATFGYLELHFNAAQYLYKPLILVRERQFRSIILQALPDSPGRQFADTGRLPPASLLSESAIDRIVAAAEAPGPGPDSPMSLAGLLAGLSDHPQLRRSLDLLSARVSSFLDGTAVSLTGANAQVAEKWSQLGRAWRSRDAGQANRLIGEIAEALECSANGYPSRLNRRLEQLYNRTYHATIVWVGFAAASIMLIAAASGGRRWARLGGMGLMVASTGALLAGFVARWIISGRQWYLPPIMNQFEAVVGSALLGAMLAIGLELVWKRNYLALAAGLYATVALLMGMFLPEQMGADIRPMPGLLSAKIMALHVAVIIVGHALVGMSAIISAAYLVTATVRGLGRSPSSEPDLGGGRATEPCALEVIDRGNLIVVQLAAWTVAAGTMLGAYWADFAWGRWWGWDAKETWAMVTAIIYLAIVHVRFVTPVRWRGLVTAILCVVGAAVMLFNWVGVNYLLTGMHSYA